MKATPSNDVKKTVTNALTTTNRQPPLTNNHQLTTNNYFTVSRVAFCKAFQRAA